MFSVPILGMLGDAKMTCMRALLSTFVEPDELGRYGYVIMHTKDPQLSIIRVEHRVT